MKLLALLTLALPLLAQQHGTDPVQLDTGARIYSANCSVCHGPDGDQVSGVELKRGKFRRASTDDELAKIIQTGIPGTAMPPNAIGSGNLVALVAYLHAMRDFKTKKVALGNAAGSVFKNMEWTGRVVRSERPSTHGRIIRVWRLK